VVDRKTNGVLPGGYLQVIDLARPTHPVLVNSIVDDPVMESGCYERHNEAACVSTNRGRVAVAGTVVHQLTGDCLCGAGISGCNDYSG